MARKWIAIQRTSDAVLNQWVNSRLKLTKRFHLFRRSAKVAMLSIISFVIVTGLATITSAVEHTDRSATGLSPQTLIEQSQRHLANGNLSEAIDSQETALQLLRQDSAPSINIAISLTNLGQLNMQAGHFREAYQNFVESNDLYSVSLASENLDSVSLDPVINRYRLQNRKYQVQTLRQLGQYQTACLMMANTLGLSGDGLREPSLGELLCTTGNTENITFEHLAPGATQPFAALQAQLLRELGVSLRVLGHLDAAEEVLSRFQFQSTDAATQLSLANTKYAQGNLIRDRLASPRYDAMPWRFDRERLPDITVGPNGEPGPDYQTMQNYYENAQHQYTKIEENEISNTLKTQAKLNHLSLKLDQIALLDANDSQREKIIDNALKLAQSININYLPIGQARIFSQIKMAKYQTFLNQLCNTERIPWNQIQSALDNAQDMAKALNNSRALSYVLGNQGGLYEYFAWLEPQGTLNTERWINLAAQLTQAALVNAQPTDAPDIAYQWEWQLGRLARERRDRESAIAHYKLAVDTLQSVRNDLVNINADVRFSFRDNVEPIYRGLVDVLLLENSSTQDIEEVVQIIDGLQLAELESFLRCNLASTLQVNRDLEKIDDKAVFVYPIILSDRLEVITKFPDQQVEHHPQLVLPDYVEDKLNDFQNLIKSDGGVLSSDSNSLIYDWLFGAIEEKIENKLNIETIVFVPDSAFRNLSITALYDEDTNSERGGEYVLEKKYATVLLPSSQLFDLDKTRQEIQVLAIGIDKEQKIGDRSFDSLKVREEIEAIKKILSNTEILFDTQATLEGITNQIQSVSPSILHFATHGDFSSDPDETFIVLYQELLRSQKFDTFLEVSNNNQRSIDLLTLSACRTATGDNRAVLGIAGIAIQTGAKSILSSLWAVDDEPTVTLMAAFYQELSNPDIKISEALHRAQLSILYKDETQSEFNLPSVWAPFILVGGWL